MVWGGDTKADATSDAKQDDGLYLLNLGMFLLTQQVRLTKMNSLSSF